MNSNQAVILNNPFYFILFISFVNSLTQNISIYSQYIVYKVNGIGDRESVNTTIGGVQILSEAFLNMFLTSASFTGELFFDRKQNFCSWDYSSRLPDYLGSRTIRHWIKGFFLYSIMLKITCMRTHQ
jgi:hypothetical protein